MPPLISTIFSNAKTFLMIGLKYYISVNAKPKNNKPFAYSNGLAEDQNNNE